LRTRGHSKEGRDNDPQVIIALAVTRDGIPVRSWVLPGDTADVSTVERIKEDLRQMRLGRALFVGDAGLYAKANLAELSRGAGCYILATPIGRVKEIKEEVLSRPGRYAEITPNLRAKEVIVGRGERRRRYILCLNTEEAARRSAIAMRSSTACGSSSTISPVIIPRRRAAWSPPSASARTCRSTPRAGPSSTVPRSVAPSSSTASSC
jgi:hypothetical protein